MKVKVKYLALYRELIGKFDEEFQLVENSTVEVLLNKIMSTYPSLKDAQDDTTISLNGMLTNKNSMLKDKDVVALFPVTSGG